MRGRNKNSATRMKPPRGHISTRTPALPHSRTPALPHSRTPARKPEPHPRFLPRAVAPSRFVSLSLSAQILGGGPSSPASWFPISPPHSLLPEPPFRRPLAHRFPVPIRVVSSSPSVHERPLTPSPPTRRLRPIHPRHCRLPNRFLPRHCAVIPFKIRFLSPFQPFDPSSL